MAIESTHLYKYSAIGLDLQPFLFVLAGMIFKLFFISFSIFYTWKFSLPRKVFVTMAISFLLLTLYPIIQGGLSSTLSLFSGAIWINYWLTFSSALILFITERNRLGLFIKIFIVVTMVGVILGYLQGNWFEKMTTSMEVRMYEKGRALGFYGQPNVLGINAFLSLLLIFIAGKFNQLGLQNAGWLVSFIIVLILLSGSRIAIGVTAASFLIIFNLYGLFSSGRLKKSGVMAAIFSSSVLILGFTFINYQSNSIDASIGSGDNILARLSYIWLALTGGIDDVFLDRSAYLRSSAFSEYMSYIIQKPLIGWGLGSEALMRGIGHITIHSHSSVLSILLEFGLLGFFILLFIMFIFARKIRSLKSISFAEYGVFISSIFLLLIFSSVFTYNLFFIILAAAMSIGSVSLVYIKN
jgi:O-antigen ligase